MKLIIGEEWSGMNFIIEEGRIRGQVLRPPGCRPMNAIGVSKTYSQVRIFSIIFELGGVFLSLNSTLKMLVF